MISSLTPRFAISCTIMIAMASIRARAFVNPLRVIPRKIPHQLIALEQQRVTIQTCGAFTEFPSRNCGSLPWFIKQRHVPLYLTKSPFSSDTYKEELTMEHIYQEWTLDEDKYLFRHSQDPLYKLASKLGRGLGGVQARLAKLKDRNSSAYARMFAGSEEDENKGGSSKGLTPAAEVLRRIKWDYSLSPSDFTVQYYDRMEDKLLDTAFDAPNNTVKGKEEYFVFAIPEHRIASIRYREQTVWDKEERLDLVFGSMNGNGITIDVVIEQYEEWQKQKDLEQEYMRQRQIEVSSRIKLFLGPERFSKLKSSSDKLRVEFQQQEQWMDGSGLNKSISSYISSSLELFEDARKEVPPEYESLAQVPYDVLESLEMFSEIVVLLPDLALKEIILEGILKVKAKVKGETLESAPLPELKEADLTEKFVRGSGAGGQKINKTSNRVVLVHEPTQLRVECQDTRSLAQNRKIARKRMLEKLDIHINGEQSRFILKEVKKAVKKQKAKAKTKTRLAKKKQEVEDEAEVEN